MNQAGDDHAPCEVNGFGVRAIEMLADFSDAVAGLLLVAR